MVDNQTQLNSLYQKTIPKTRPPREKIEQAYFFLKTQRIHFQPPDLVIYFNRFRSRSNH